MGLPLPGLPSFDYIRPESLERASQLLLDSKNNVRPLLGGTDILVQMRDGAIKADLLVDLKQLPGMCDIAFNKKQGLKIGAGVSMNAIAGDPAVSEHFPLLVESANSVASYQLRNRATLGGNLCNASPAADMAPAILVLEANLVAFGKKGERIVPADNFFQGPGENALSKGEFLTRIEIPAPPAGWKGRYLKLGRNTEGDLAIVGAAVMGYPDPSVPSGLVFRIALASVAPTPIRISPAEEILSGNPITDEVIEEAAQAAYAACDPIDDVRAAAVYRREMVRVFTRRGIQAVWAMLLEEG